MDSSLKREAYQFAATPAAFFTPNYQRTSAWHEHVPFGFWLIESLNPSVLVELGTYYGVSYFAFCQAIKQLQLTAKTFAVDTWRGDLHSGFYGNEIFSDVSSHNSEHYSLFSTLMRRSFDGAIEQFRDGEIDLLHIDGHYTYESVKHDFEAWLPRLSGRSVVLLHNTNIRERDFGVHRLHDELKSRYAHFEFTHGHGLAVIGTGPEPAPKLRQLFECQQVPARHLAVMNVFSRLGQACRDSFLARSNSEELETLREKLRSSVDQLQKRQADDMESLAEADATAMQLQQEISTLQQTFTDERVEFERRASERDHEIVILTKLIRDLEGDLSKARACYREADADGRKLVEILRYLTRRSVSFLPRSRSVEVTELLERSGIVDRDWYLNEYPDVGRAGVDPTHHYLQHGANEGRYPNPRIKYCPSSNLEAK